MSDPDRWPDYFPDLQRQFHALGVVAANFNRLEHRFLGLFLVYLGFNDATAFLFARLRDNSLRIDMLRRSVAIKGETDAVKTAVNWFSDCFDAAAQNRNVLMHAGISNVIEAGEITHLIFSKGAKQNATEWNRYLLDAEALRRVADEIYAVSKYGRELFLYVTSHYHPELSNEPFPPPVNAPFPETPPRPTLLIPQEIPAAIASLPRQQSSLG